MIFLIFWGNYGIVGFLYEFLFALDHGNVGSVGLSEGVYIFAVPSGTAKMIDCFAALSGTAK